MYTDLERSKTDFFFCLIALARTSSTTLNRSSKRGCLFLVPDLRRKASSCSPLSLMLAIEFCFFFLTTLFIYLFLWLCWVFVFVQGLSLVVASRGHSSSRCAGLSLSRPLLLRGTGSRRAGSVIVAHGPSCSTACGIFPDQGSNPCPLHWQADSQPLRHQGSPAIEFFWYMFFIKLRKFSLFLVY